ncbi:uncharacterized protein LOC144609402 isoform X2 [Rhinoraja longicauda]
MQSQMLKLGEIINHPTQYANIHCGLIVKQAFFSPSDAAVRSNLRFLRSVTMETTRFCSHSDPAEAADRSSGSAIKTAVASFVGLHRPASEMSSTGAGLRCLFPKGKIADSQRIRFSPTMSPLRHQSVKFHGGAGRETRPCWLGEEHSRRHGDRSGAGFSG